MTNHPLFPFNFKRDLDPFNWLRREVDTLFDTLWRSPNLQSQPSSYERNFPLIPDIDVSETHNEFTISADLPGLEEKDINVDIYNNILRISGEKKLEREEKDKNFYRMERLSGSFDRSIQLSSAINEDNIQANFKNGVLTITLPKSAENPNGIKHIEVKKG